MSGSDSRRQVRDQRQLAALGAKAKLFVKKKYAAAFRRRLGQHLRRCGSSTHMDNCGQPVKLPAPKEVTWLLYRRSLKDEARQIVDRIRKAAPDLQRAGELAHSFQQIVEGRRSDQLREWIVQALDSNLPELRSFARGITDDLLAVKAALTHDWSQGQVEGQVNRLKMIKKQMYGRANFDLLRAKVLWTTRLPRSPESVVDAPPVHVRRTALAGRDL